MMAGARPAKKRPEDISTAPLREVDMTMDEWAEFEHGVTLFNTGKFWHAHEAWEHIWINHAEDERLFFQGIIQLAAAYHHLMVKHNLRGTVNNLDKAQRILTVFQPEFLGVSVSPLLELIERGKTEAARLGEQGLDKFSLDLIPKLRFHKQNNPDLMIELREVQHGEGFLEGVKLFNDHYHWEAHEVWEDVWRNADGDAKLFTQAFVQMAAAYSFISLRKPESAMYLLEKSIEKFQQFEKIDCCVQLPPLIESLTCALKELGVVPKNGHTRPHPFVSPTIRIKEE